MVQLCNHSNPDFPVSMDNIGLMKRLIEDHDTWSANLHHLLLKILPDRFPASSLKRGRHGFNTQLHSLCVLHRTRFNDLKTLYNLLSRQDLTQRAMESYLNEAWTINNIAVQDSRISDIPNSSNLTPTDTVKAGIALFQNGRELWATLMAKVVGFSYQQLEQQNVPWEVTDLQQAEAILQRQVTFATVAGSMSHLPKRLDYVLFHLFRRPDFLDNAECKTSRSLLLNMTSDFPSSVYGMSTYVVECLPALSWDMSKRVLKILSFADFLTCSVRGLEQQIRPFQFRQSLHC